MGEVLLCAPSPAVHCSMAGDRRGTRGLHPHLRSCRYWCLGHRSSLQEARRNILPQGELLCCSCEAPCPCCRQTHVQGSGVLQHVAPPSKATSRRTSRDRPVRVAGCSAEASQPLENEGFVSRPSQRRLESPLDPCPATRMLSAWRERGLLRPCSSGAGCARDRERRGRPGPVSSRPIRVMDLSPLPSAGASALCRTAGSAHSLPRSQEPRAIRKQPRYSAEMCRAWKCAAVCNIFPFETSRRCLPSHCSRKEEEEWESQDTAERSST